MPFVTFYTALTDSSDNRVLCIVVLAMSTLWISRQIRAELTQYRQDSKHFSGMWNLVDVAYILLFLATVTLLASGSVWCCKRVAATQ